jgi:hypothetical protein
MLVTELIGLPFIPIEANKSGSPVDLSATFPEMVKVCENRVNEIVLKSKARKNCMTLKNYMNRKMINRNCDSNSKYDITVFCRFIA